MTTMTLRLDDETHRRLERLAQATSRSRAWLAGDALNQYLDLQEWQVKGIEQAITQAEAGDLVPHEVVRRRAEERLANVSNPSVDPRR